MGTRVLDTVPLLRNWHEHSATCWKYLKKNQPHVDKNCRMRMDGMTREKTTIDEESKIILLRRLHPKIILLFSRTNAILALDLSDLGKVRKL